MATLPVTPSVVQDIVNTEEERTFWEVVRHHERPPYFFENEGVGNRLARAARVVTDERITPNSDGSYTVEGSEGRTYRVTDSCSCPQSQKGKSKHCYHMVAVALYVEWQRRLRPVAPVDLGTLRAGTLPLPPTTVDERLARPTPEPAAVTQAVREGQALLGTLRDATAQCVTNALQEDRMADDGYIPEPDDAPVAVLEAPPEPVRQTIPAEYVMSIKGKRHVLYAGLVIVAQRSGLVSLAADWTYNDAELSLAHAVATFADGRRYEESGDASPGNVTKGIATHFRRVALTRAKARCLRDALGISECSVEELEEDTPKREVPEMTPKPSEQELRQRIWQRIKALAPDVTGREEAERYIHERTKLDLHPDNYAAILERLEGQGR